MKLTRIRPQAFRKTRDVVRRPSIEVPLLKIESKWFLKTSTRFSQRKSPNRSVFSKPHRSMEWPSATPVVHCSKVPKSPESSDSDQDAPASVDTDWRWVSAQCRRPTSPSDQESKLVFASGKKEDLSNSSSSRL